MIDSQLRLGQLFAAVLAGALVALEDIAARKADFLVKKSVEHVQQNDFGDADPHGRRVDEPTIVAQAGELAPVFEVV